MSLRKGVVKLDIQENAYVLVYHKFLDIGSGPSIGLYLYNTEILRFDCFSKNKGHYHIFNKKNNGRIYFTEQIVAEQIDKTANELTTNIKSYLALFRQKNIKEFIFDQNRLASKIAEAKQILLDYEAKFYAAKR